MRINNRMPGPSIEKARVIGQRDVNTAGLKTQISLIQEKTMIIRLAAMVVEGAQPFPFHNPQVSSSPLIDQNSPSTAWNFGEMRRGKELRVSH